jgi:hypothetical protein
MAERLVAERWKNQHSYCVHFSAIHLSANELYRLRHETNHEDQTKRIAAAIVENPHPVNLVNPCQNFFQTGLT